MNAKKIATSVPGRQYEALERLRKRLGMGRSQAVQEALALWLTARQGDERVVRYLRGYTDQPDDPGDARALAEAWSQGLAAEDW
jgi:hypothetical protein